MKRLLLILTLTSCLTFVWAQDIVRERKHDITISPFTLIAFPALNISYENLINDATGIGADAFLGFGDFNHFQQVSPYFRMYFGKNYASGFFVEGFVPITRQREYIDTYFEDPYYPGEGYYGQANGDRKWSAGIGVGLGVKWIAKRNIVFEISGGLGRLLIAADNLDGPMTGKGMLGIGFKF